MMKVIQKEERTPNLIEQLVSIWEESVKATHLFLSEEEIENIKTYVPKALKQIPHLIIETDEHGKPNAFMGIDNHKLEMLFILPQQRGKGLGRKLIEYAHEIDEIHELTVNEQNPAAQGFYEHMGFIVYKRTSLDEQGNPYPILYMKRINFKNENIS